MRRQLATDLGKESRNDKHHLRFIWALLIVLLGIGGVLADPQPPGCFPDVFDLVIAQATHPGPIGEIGCPPPPDDPCIAGPAPTIDFQIGEEALLIATASAEDDDNVGDVIEAKLMVSKKNPYATYYPYYTVTTVDTIQLGYQRIGTTQNFKFGVPGLDKGEEYLARVAFCYSYINPPPAPYANRFCECESAEVYFTPANTGWKSASPAPAEDSNEDAMTQQAEDDFKRPQTIAKRNQSGTPLGGNGVSPGSLPWIDEFSLPAANGATISDERESVVLKQGMMLAYAEQSKGKTQYAEVLVHKASSDPGTDGKYNFDLEARLVASASNSMAYAVKLTKGHVGESPDDHILYITNTDGIAGLDAGTNTFAGVSMNVETDCGAVPPLADTGPTNDVWMRIVVENNQVPKALVTGWVAWDCSLDGQGQPVDIDECTYSCSKTWLDTENTLGLASVFGQWAFSAHEHTYEVKLFRAGYKPGS